MATTIHQAIAALDQEASQVCTLVPAYAKRRLHDMRAPVRLRLGGGAAHVNRTRLSPYVTAPERMSKQGAGLRVNGLWTPQRSRRSAIGTTEHATQASPTIGQ